MIRILLVFENRLFSDLLTAVLKDQPDILVTDITTSINQAEGHVAGCDVILMSSRLPEKTTLQFIRAVTKAQPAPRVLVLSAQPLAENESRGAILQYIEAGAFGYVLLEDSVDRLLEKIRAAGNGTTLISPKIAYTLMERVAQLSEYAASAVRFPDAVGLTPREYDILDLVARGCSNREIADRLEIEVGTVKQHVHSILEKLNVDNRHHAALYLLFPRPTPEKSAQPPVGTDPAY